jgi:hypothetical protein
MPFFPPQILYDIWNQTLSTVVGSQQLLELWQAMFVTLLMSFCVPARINMYEVKAKSCCIKYEGFKQHA